MITLNELQKEVDESIEKCNVYKDYIKHGASYIPTNAFGLIQYIFSYELNNGVYTKIKPVITVKEIKKELQKQSKSLSKPTDKISFEIYTSKELANTTDLDESLMLWAEKELGVYLTLSTSSFASDSTSRFVPTLYKINYANSYKQGQAYIKELVEAAKNQPSYIRTSIYVKLDYSNIPLTESSSPTTEIQTDFINKMAEKYDIYGQYDYSLENLDEKTVFIRFDK